ncbi:MAG: dihydrofolate reductase [Candidatus Paceibacterota bacterium]
MKKPIVHAVAALGKRTRAIGKKNRLLWHIPDDLKHFKEITTGYPVIMGRKTFESIRSMLGTPLPGRRNIVITRQDKYNEAGVWVASSINEALTLAESDRVFIIGGQQIYEQALPLIDCLHLTLIDSDEEGDTWFPPYEHLFTNEIGQTEQREYKGLRYCWIALARPGNSCTL